MSRKKRLRKKLHRKYLTTVCAWVLTFDDELRDRLLKSEAATPFPILSSSHRGIQGLMRRWRLRFWVAMAWKHAPQTATVVYWAAEFPEVRDEAVIFSRVDLSLNER
jgi:hypothetical protein